MELRSFFGMFERFYPRDLTLTHSLHERTCAWRFYEALSLSLSLSELYTTARTTCSYISIYLYIANPIALSKYWKGSQSPVVLLIQLDGSFSLPYMCELRLDLAKVHTLRVDSCLPSSCVLLIMHPGLLLFCAPFRPPSFAVPPISLPLPLFLSPLSISLYLPQSQFFGLPGLVLCVGFIVPTFCHLACIFASYPLLRLCFCLVPFRKHVYARVHMSRA